MTESARELTPAPLITPEQLALEAKARELREHPRVEALAAKVKALMRAGFGIDVPSSAASRFDAEMDEYVFSYVERVLCRDPNNFCIHYTSHPPYHRSSGVHVPGCRFYGENPDTIYRWGGLPGNHHYRLRCRPVGPATSAASFTLMRTYGGTTPGNVLVHDQLVRDADGSFVITIDSDPPNGRPNHLQAVSGTRLLLVREFLDDWETETPLEMTLEAAGVSRGGVWDDESALDDICFFAIEELYLYFWMCHIYRNLEPNSVTPPLAAEAMGGSSSMATCQGFFQFAEDEAVVLHWDPAAAKFSSLSLLDWWFLPIEAHRLQSSLNAFTASRNADGTVTAVIAASDPGIANWLETDGLRDVLMTGRWQELPSAPRGGGPRLDARLVKLAELERHLPADIARCSPEERRIRNARRLGAYTRRTGDLESRFTSIPA